MSPLTESSQQVVLIGSVSVRIMLVAAFIYKAPSVIQPGPVVTGLATP
ncbi:MAG: hypothetical protein KKD28_01520 [Chloroflexi bacterium]|nr:hypothetical protein [Chloroflexota bacterium]MBU1660133.1 hypothetical protein [Chloroflexota bacterium]